MHLDCYTKISTCLGTENIYCQLNRSPAEFRWQFLNYVHFSASYDPFGRFEPLPLRLLT